MFGYACDETPELMPLPISLAHKLMKGIQDLRESGKILWLRPDAKSQVTVEYDENDRPVRVDTVVVSTQHAESFKGKELPHATIEKESSESSSRVFLSCQIDTINGSSEYPLSQSHLLRCSISPVIASALS